MGLTPILTTIGPVHLNTLKCEILIPKENWTSVDVGGPAADVWGSKTHELKARQPDQAAAVDAGPRRRTAT